MRARGRWAIATIGGALLVAVGFVGASRVRHIRENAARFAWSLGGDRVVGDSAQRGWVAASSGTEAFVARVGERGLDARMRLQPGSALTHVSALFSLDASRVAYSAVARTDGGFRAWTGILGPARPRPRELAPADALVVDGAGVLNAIVPCHTSSTAASVQEWTNDASRCVIAVPTNGELGLPRSVCNDCFVSAAAMTGTTLRAWVVREQRRSVLVSLDGSGPARDIAGIDFTLGPGSVSRARFGPDGSSVTVGSLTGTLTTGDRKLRSEAGSDAFVVGYAADGHVRFARALGTTAAEGALDVTLLADGSARVLVEVHSDIAPRWIERLLGGRTASNDAVELVELDATGEVRRRRRYAVASSDRSYRLKPRMIGGTDALAYLAVDPAVSVPLVASRPEEAGYLIVGLAVQGD